ncbi:MAG: tetratricopeptide repeat protein [Cyanobacteria bacterium CRU_2_1]|nr:tetratricopeptide repeat protein [Cyanobacteria bacterium CRU_2_1]
MHRWCRAIERAQQPDASDEQCQLAGDREAAAILNSIQGNDGVKRLTTNPLLLTILALIHRNGTMLPHRRVELYALAVKTLTETWQMGRNAAYNDRQLAALRLRDVELQLREREVVDLLAPLAYWMHEHKPTGTVTEGEAEQQLIQSLAELRDIAPDSPDMAGIQQDVTKFLRTVRETTGLFVERAPNLYGFMHLTFEEYFAALQIAGNGPDGMLDIIQQRLPEPRWEEPILLALGYYSIYNSQKQVSKLLEQLFSDLTAYQPTLIEEIIKLKNASSTDAMLVWSSAANPTETHEFPLKDLLLAGQVATQVEFKSNLRKQWIEKLIVTVLALKLDSADDTVKQILRSLRQIESFNQQGEVIAQLVRVIEDDALIEEIRARARATLLYVICGQPSASLVGHLTELISQLDPTLFWIIKELVAELGEEITPHLEEACSHVQANDLDNQQIVNFVTAVSYIRSGMNKSGTDHYDTAISRLQHLVGQPENSLKPYLTLSLATCYQEKQDYGKAEEYYRECDAQLAHSISTWRERGECQRLYGKYAMALASFQQMHTLAQTLEKSEEEADALYYMGRTYVDWGKYQEAIAHYEQSRDRYTQIGEELSVADQWHWLGDCYKDWGKYPQAVECQQKELEIRSQLNDQLNVAKADWGLGKIYQAWGKYEAAIAHYQKSGDRYEQLDKQKDAVTQWSWIGNCYKDWGKYERAIECQEQCLAKHQELGDQADVALSYYQLGRIHQDWGKYEEAIAAYEQSRELYQQLGKEADVSNQWGWLADCYKDWGKYEQAIECQQQCLAKRQELGDQADVALSYSQLGTIYKAWDKHEEAITHFQQSRVLYEQLDKKKDVAIQWDWIAYTYQEWGKYEQALEYRQKCFEIRQTLNDQSLIALTHPQFGWIYQDWGKYEEAIAHFQRSRDIYAQLNRDKDVADQWKNLADCYQKWSKYPEAVECQKRCLEIRTTLDSPSLIAVSYYQLGRIYRAWGKYGEAIAAHEQSRELYQQLGKEADVGKLWGWLADCYRDWGRYEQAMEAVQQCLQMRQKLDDPSGIANVHYQFGCIYQAWGKYEEAIAAHEQSRELYQQLGKEADVGNQWDNFADCYRDWGRYEQALEAAQQCLQMRQKLDDPSGIAWVHYQFGCIYQAWGKYEEAIAYHQQSLAIYEQLNLETNIANQWDWIAYCYFQWEKYELAAEFQQRCLNLCQSLDLKLDVADAASWLGRIYKDWHQYDRAMEYHQQSLDLYQEADHREKVARQFRYIAYLQYRQAKDAADSDTAIDLLTQADPNLQRAIQLDNAGDYRENLAYDHTALALLAAEHLRHLPSNAPTIPYLTQFEQAYQTGFTRLTELGQTVDQADEALDIARAYLDVDALRNIDRAEKLARQCLQTFQDYNRRKLEAAARKLLGEIYLARAQHPHSDARVIASTFLNNALQLYRDLDLEEKATEVEHLIQANLL